MMIVASPSVPHTGRHFMENRVFRDFHKTAPLGRVDGDTLIVGHFETRTLRAWSNIAKSFPTVIPLRHPARCWESFKRRNTVQSTFANFHAQWMHLIDVVSVANDVCFLHLDDKELRLLQIKNIQNRFGIQHNIVWSVGADTGSKMNTHEIPVRDCDYKVIPREFMEFYEESKGVYDYAC